MNSTSNDILPEGYKITELGVLPEEWEVARLGEIFNVQQGKQLSEKESKEGKIKKSFLRTSNLNWGHIDISSIDEMYYTLEEFEKLRLKNGDILVCEGGDVGRTALYRGELVECAYQNHLHRLRTKKDNLDVEYFVFWMNYAINQRKMYIHSANRTTIPNLSGSRLKEFLIPLPPLPEQQKIAAVLSAVQEAKEKTEAVIAATKALKKSMMKHLFTYGPVSPEEAENVPLKETEIGPVPEDWEVVRLGEVLENKNIKFKNLENNYKDIPVLSITREFGLIRQEHKFDKRVASKDLSNYKIVEKGNVVVGFPIDEGVISILFNSDYGLVSPTYEIWQLKSKNIDLYFFDTILRHSLMMNQYLKYMTRGVERRRIIKKNDFIGLFVPLPPFPTQQKIASILSAIDAKIEAEENKKKALEELFKSLLHNLMTARIRVNKLEVPS